VLRRRGFYLGSRIQIFFLPRSCRIPLTTTIKKRGKRIVFLLFCSHKFHKIGNYFIFELEQEKLAPIDEISSIYNLKIVTKLSEMWFRIQKKFIPDPVPGSKMLRIPVRIRNTAFLCGRICFPDRVAGVVHLDWIGVLDPDPTV
jgi:hypothetical protein